MPASMSYRLQGQSQILDETTNLIMAIALAVIFVYMVLASQFESFIQPVVIMRRKHGVRTRTQRGHATETLRHRESVVPISVSLCLGGLSLLGVLPRDSFPA